MTQSTKQPSLLQALIPLLALIIMLASSVYFFGEDSSYGPNQIALWVASGIALIIGVGLYLSLSPGKKNNS